MQARIFLGIRDARLRVFQARALRGHRAHAHVGAPAVATKGVGSRAGLDAKLFLRTMRRVGMTSDREAALQWTQKILGDDRVARSARAGITC